MNSYSEEWKVLEMYEHIGLDITQGIPKLDNHRATRVKFHPDGNVKEIHLEDLNLNNIPNELQDFQYLEILYLGNNHLKFLPDWFPTSFPNLKWLNITFNELKILPENFGFLSNLKYLILTSNKLEQLPESFGNLVNLEVLSLISNKFTSFPLPLIDLENLNSLYLLNNPIKPNSFSNIYAQYRDQTQSVLSKAATFYKHYLNPENLGNHIVENQEGLNVQKLFCYYCKRPTDRLIQICELCQNELELI